MDTLNATTLRLTKIFLTCLCIPGVTIAASGILRMGILPVDQRFERAFRMFRPICDFLQQIVDRALGLIG